MADPHFAGWPGRAAVAVTHGEAPQVLLAESTEVLSRAIAMFWVARTPADQVPPAFLGGIRRALLDEDWSEAVLQWMFSAGELVDAYPDETIWTDDRLDADRAALEIRMAPIFRDADE